jgi:hypothetical protein
MSKKPLTLSFLSFTLNPVGGAELRMSAVLTPTLTITIRASDSSAFIIEDFSDIMTDGRSRMEHFQVWCADNEQVWSKVVTRLRAAVVKMVATAKRAGFGPQAAPDQVSTAG